MNKVSQQGFLRSLTSNSAENFRCNLALGSEFAIYLFKRGNFTYGKHFKNGTEFENLSDFWSDFIVGPKIQIHLLVSLNFGKIFLNFRTKEPKKPLFRWLVQFFRKVKSALFKEKVEFGACTGIWSECDIWINNQKILFRILFGAFASRIPTLISILCSALLPLRYQS